MANKRGQLTKGIAFIDAMILKLLLGGGYTVGKRVGIKELGLSAKAISKELKGEGATASMVAGRCNSLKQKGYTKSVLLLPTNQGIGYQITEKGKEALSEYEREYGKDR